MTLSHYLRKLVRGLLSLFTGLGVTIKWFFNFKGIVTEQYPENRATLKQHERFRCQVVMPHDEQGEHKCTGCQSCERACPNGSISVLNTKNIAGKKILAQYIYRLDTCTFCGMCVESCGFDAIKMSNDFELSSTTRDHFEIVLNKKEGRG